MQIKTPTLLFDEQKCRINIQRMVEKANHQKVLFRPHFKTHQSHEIGRLFREYGIDKIAVSSVQMARYFAADDWKDITIAFPLNILEADDITELNKKIHLNVLVESKRVLEYLDLTSNNRIGFFIKIDTGYRRTGIRIEDIDVIDEIIDYLSKSDRCCLKGFLVHNGHTYKAKSTDEIKKIHQDSLKKLIHLKERYTGQFPDLIISMGDTPSMSVMDDFKGVDEIRPGNFVFYDLMQSHLGACSEKDIAVAMACPVVAKHKDRNQVVIYGGGVHFSKESIPMPGHHIFGKVVFLKESAWEIPEKSSYVVSLSQEHGIIQLDEDTIHQISIGDIIGILPVHSCLTADLHHHYLSLTNQIIPKV